jgi:hypothetical protein
MYGRESHIHIASRIVDSGKQGEYTVIESILNT